MPTTKTERLGIKISDDVVRVRQLTRTFAVEVGLGIVDAQVVGGSSAWIIGSSRAVAGGGAGEGCRGFSQNAAGCGGLGSENSIVPSSEARTAAVIVIQSTRLVERWTP